MECILISSTDGSEIVKKLDTEEYFRFVKAISELARQVRLVPAKLFSLEISEHTVSSNQDGMDILDLLLVSEYNMELEL